MSYQSAGCFKKILDCLGLPSDLLPDFAGASAGMQFSPQYWITLSIIKIHHIHTAGAYHLVGESSAKFTAT